MRECGRRAERGAALFIVMMVITLLTAVGVFAVRTTSLADVAAGYNRQAVQSSYLSEYAARSVVAEMSVAPDTYLNPFNNPPAELPNCRSTAGIPDAVCFTRQHFDIVESLDESIGIDDPDDFIGRLGNGSSRGAFHIEVFEASAAPERQAGESETATFRQVTITAEARIQPVAAGADPNVCTDAVATTTSVQAVRGHVRFGPFGAGR